MCSIWRSKTDFIICSLSICISNILGQLKQKNRIPVLEESQGTVVSICHKASDPDIEVTQKGEAPQSNQ